MNDSTRPGEARLAGLSIAPVFERHALLVVDFDRVHVRLVRPGTNATAFDTSLTFPPGVDSLPLAVTVPVQGNTERFALTMDFVKAPNDTVFKTGPDTISVVPGVISRPLQPPARYTGVGANATSIRIDSSATGVFFRDTLLLLAQAYDSAGAPIPGTPIAWSALDTPRVSVPDPALGRVVAGISRGNARVVASLLRTTRDTTVQPKADTSTVAVQPRPSAIAIVGGDNQTGTVGTPLTNQLAVKVTADDGLGVKDVLVNFGVATGGGSLSAPSVPTNDTGLAVVTWTLGRTAGAQSVTATVPVVAGATRTFTAAAVAGAPTQLAFVVQPSNATAGAVIGPPIQVALKDASGNTAILATGNVTIALGANPSGGTLSGTLTVAAVNGIATFGNLGIHRAGAGYTLVATATGLTSATSTAFNVVAAPPSRLVFTVQPSNAAAGVAIAPALQVTVQDSLGNTVTTATNSVTLAIGTNPGGATLSGTATVVAVNGVATFSTLSLDRAATGYTLVATATGLTAATSAAFTVTSIGPLSWWPANGSAVDTADGNHGLLQNGTTFGPGVRGQAFDLDGIDDGVSFGNAPSLQFSTGDFTVNAWVNLRTLGGDRSIVDKMTGLNASGWRLLKQVNGRFWFCLGGGGGNGCLGPPPTLQSTTVPAANTWYHVAAVKSAAGLQLFVNGALEASGSLPAFTDDNAGNLLVGSTAASCCAAFVDGRIDEVQVYNRALSAAQIDSIYRAGLATPAQLAFTVQPASAAINAVIAPPIQVAVQNALGTTLTGNSATQVTVAITPATGTAGAVLAGTTTVTAASGIATFGTLSVDKPGTGYTLTASATGLTGTTSTAFDITAAAASVATTTVTPRLDTLTALTATRALAAQARNAAGNPVAGTFTWVSRTPTVATVSAAGLVTAVANGSAYVVATEAGGTKDSALIVVQQRIATINVTPGARNIYLTRSFTFTATAVDGLGSPVAGVTSFTWSSTAPAVATVDTAGNVMALGLGATQIRATSGAITGVATVNVITPITRIAVVVDTVGAFKTDTFTLTSLGLTRRYRAIAHDTLDAVMTGVTFTWVSTNGSVAVLTSFTGDTATVTSAANGVTSIQATAQGFTSAPGAFLTVSQVLASIALTAPASNPTATIAISGTAGLVARGKDANSRFISAGSFTFASATPAVATIGANTGVVTGVANGTADMTATSGAITSNVLTVTVGGAVASIISFGRDTVSVGRGSSAPIPILLSKPAGSPLTVNLTATAFAHWSTASITIPANQTSANATLVGDSAGTTTVTATDGSSLGYASASAVAKVTANMRLATGGYAINATDIVQTQVLLSDPSPAGGTYVTFGYGTAGIAAISPDPAFIPAGQLAADIQIRGLAGGTTTITPSAIGVNGTASSFTAYAPVLTTSANFLRLGQAQYEPNLYVYTPTYTNVAVPVTLTSSDTNVVNVTPSVTIPGGSYFAYFTTTARAIGTATITVSATGWTAAGTIAVTSTTPYVGICCGTTLYTTSPLQNVTVYAQDSVRTAHYRTNSLVVRLSSTGTTVLRVLDSVVTIAPGQYFTSAARVIPGGLGGTAYIVATASGHRPDSVLYTVLGPPLTFGWLTNRIGAGQEDYNLYVYTPNNVTTPLVVTLANPDSTILGVPTTVTIPTGTNLVYFTVRGKAPGSVTLTATAAGFQSATASYIVTSPRVVISGGYTINNFAPARAYTTYATDSLGTAHYRSTPLAISLRSSDSTVITTDPSATIPAGQYFTSTPILTPVNVGSARIVATAAGHGADSTTYTIIQPKLNVSFYSYLLGRRQRAGPNAAYVNTPDNRAVSVPVTLTQKRATVDSLSATALTIPASSNIGYFTFFGLTNGVDTVIATATGYAPDTAFITVTTPRFTNCCMPTATTTTNQPIGITVYATDSLGSAHFTSDTVVVRAVSSDTTVIRPVQPFFRIPKDAYFASTTVNIVGPGTASITYSDSALTGYLPTTTGTITVTGPSLALVNGSPVLGMRQTGGSTGSYVYTPNNVATPLVVNLLSTGTRVVTVPASVTIPALSNFAYFQVTAQDTVGTIQIQASALGYNAATMNVQVTQPKFVMSTASQLNTTSARQNITVYAADANGTTHYTTENVTVTLASSAPSVASIDSTTVTILSGNYFHNTATWGPGIVGTAQLSASDVRAALYKYNTGTVNVAVITPTLNFSWGSTPLGIGQYIDQYVYRPDYPAVPLTVALSHTGTARVSTLVGGAPVTSVTIPASSNIVYFRTVGTSTGTDTLVASATSPAHNPATAYTVVGQGTINPIGGWPASLRAGDSVQVTLFARDPAGNGRYVLAATTFTLAPNANIQFVSGGASSVVITSITIPADQYFVSFYIKGVSAGTGSASITATNYQSYSNTVTVTP